MCRYAQIRRTLDRTIHGRGEKPSSAHTSICVWRILGIPGLVCRALRHRYHTAPSRHGALEHVHSWCTEQKNRRGGMFMQHRSCAGTSDHECCCAAPAEGRDLGRQRQVCEHLQVSQRDVQIPRRICSGDAARCAMIVHTYVHRTWVHRTCTSGCGTCSYPT